MNDQVNIIEAIDDLAQRLRRYRFRCSTELALHVDVGKALALEHYVSQAEFCLGSHDRIDFWLPELAIGVECKIDGGPSAVWEQLARYSQHDQVQALILLSRRRAHAIPGDSINNKPFRFVWIASQL